MVLLTPDCFTTYSHWEEYIRQLHGCGSSLLATDGQTVSQIWENIVSESDRLDDRYFGDDDD